MKFLVLFTLIASLFSQDLIEKEFSDVKSIKLSVSSSDVTISNSDDGNVYLKLTHKFDKEDIPRIEKIGTTLEIRERNRRHSFFGSKSAKYDLKVPNNLKVSFNSGSGNMDIKQVTFKKAKFNVGSGDFEFV
jgi:hypothetical protein